MRTFLVLAIAQALLALSVPVLAQPPTATIQPIPLSGPVADRQAELSGMAWHGDRLILLPQYPDRVPANGEPALYAMGRARIEAFLEGKTNATPAPEPVVFDDGGVAALVPGFQGYEAIAFQGGSAFLAIEAQTSEAVHSWIVAGRMHADGKTLSLDPKSLTQVPQPVQLHNTAHEALAAGPDFVLALYEGNGANVNPRPHALRLPLDMNMVSALPFPHVEYRVTGATAIADDGTFYALNYFFPGDKDLLFPAKDPLPHGADMGANQPVERILALRLTESGVALDGVALVLTQERKSRNWEGLALLPGRGFLICTDKFPTTILGFAPFPAP